MLNVKYDCSFYCVKYWHKFSYSTDRLLSLLCLDWSRDTQTKQLAAKQIHSFGELIG